MLWSGFDNAKDGRIIINEQDTYDLSNEASFFMQLHQQ